MWRFALIHSKRKKKFPNYYFKFYYYFHRDTTPGSQMIFYLTNIK
jgi:hypothetical protein